MPADPASSPEWSPDSLRIANQSYATYDLVVSINAGGTGRKLLISGELAGVALRHPWPTGSHLLFRVTSKEFKRAR